MTSRHLFVHPLLNRDESWAGLVLSVTGFGAGSEFGDAAVRLRRQARETRVGRSLPWFVPLEANSCDEDNSPWPLDETVFVTHEPENTSSREDWSVPAEAVRFAGGQIGVVIHPLRALPSNDQKWDFVILEASQARTLPPIKLMVLATQSKLILTGVKTRQDFEWAFANQAAMTDAEFLLHRSKEPNKPDVLRMHVLQLLSLLTQDADTQELEEIFRKEPKLSYSLLRLVNSAALSLNTPINSFSHAITLLGRRQLQRWLQLLVYANHGDDNSGNPLLQWAAVRGKLMELALPCIAPTPQLAITPDYAFMAGIFSLLDVLLNLPMANVLAQLPIPTAVKLALTERAGPLGELLSAIEAAELRKFNLASQILGDLGISSADYAQAQLTALDWGYKVAMQADQDQS
ncbi:MAG: hypothetical protein H6R18_1835 [Proteobacteria bacterium]|nr:hypothetical protein [Pseudomonadota bacterium]